MKNIMMNHQSLTYHTNSIKGIKKYSMSVNGNEDGKNQGIDDFCDNFKKMLKGKAERGESFDFTIIGNETGATVKEQKDMDYHDHQTMGINSSHKMVYKLVAHDDNLG